MSAEQLSLGQSRPPLFSESDLRSLLAPLVIEQILAMLVGMTDTLMVSSAGEAAVSGVALVDMVNYLVITVLTAVATGGAVILSQYLGSHQRSMAEQAAGQLLLITGLISAVLATACLFGGQWLLRLLFGRIEPHVMDAAWIYFRITACSFPFLGIYNASAALFRSMGQTQKTMYVSLLMNTINILGDMTGVLVLGQGVAGVAVPTVLSRATAAVVMTTMAFGGRLPVSLRWKTVFSWNGSIARKILHIAIPGGIENGLFALGCVLVTSIVSGFGTVQIAANGVAGSIDQIAIIVVNAVNLAVITVAGQCIGAGQPDQVKIYTRRLMKISWLSLGSLGSAVCLLLPVILPLYHLSGETLRLAAVLIVMHNVFAFVLHPPSFNLANALRAAGDVNYTMVVGIGSMLLFRLGSAVLFGVVLDLGVVGVWIAMGMDWLARSVAFLWRYKKKTGWKFKRYKEKFIWNIGNFQKEMSKSAFWVSAPAPSVWPGRRRSKPP